MANASLIHTDAHPIRKQLVSNSKLARVSMKNFALTVCICFVTSVTAHANSPSTPASPSKLEQRIFYLLNQERGLAGLPKLLWNDQAAQAAREHSQLLAERGELSHQFSGEPSLRERLAGTTARFTSAAENVARADNADEAHLALMYSPGHRENMLSQDYTAAGVGVVERDGKLFVTQDFIRLVPVYEEEAFRQAFVKAFNRAREARHLPGMFVQKDSALDAAACSTHGDAASLPAKPGFTGEMVVFSLSEPDQLPAQLLERAHSSGYHQMSLGVCYRPDAEHGNGNFWLVAAFYSGS